MSRHGHSSPYQNANLAKLIATATSSAQFFYGAHRNRYKQIAITALFIGAWLLFASLVFLAIVAIVLKDTSALRNLNPLTASPWLSLAEIALLTFILDRYIYSKIKGLLESGEVRPGLVEKASQSVWWIFLLSLVALLAILGLLLTRLYSG